MQVGWKTLKKFIDDTGLIQFLCYIEFDNEFYTWLSYQDQSFSVLLAKDTADCEDFVNNYKPRAVLKSDISEDGVSLSRVTHVVTGRFMRALFVLITTSTEQHNDDTGFVTVKMFDEQGNVTHDGAQAVKTALDFAPNYTYELHGGGLQSFDQMASDFFVSGIIAPEIPAQMGGSVYVVRNYLLVQPKDDVFREGLGTGELVYDSQIPQKNVMRIEVKHQKGVQARFQVEIRYYA
jgi:hypothetical protein